MKKDLAVEKKSENKAKIEIKSLNGNGIVVNRYDNKEFNKYLKLLVK